MDLNFDDQYNLSEKKKKKEQKMNLSLIFKKYEPNYELLDKFEIEPKPNYNKNQIYS